VYSFFNKWDKYHSEVEETKEQKNKTRNILTAADLFVSSKLRKIQRK